MAGVFASTQVGVREMLADFIQNVDKGKNVLLANIKRGPKPNNVEMSWQVDDYPTPVTSGVLDGKDVTTFENLSGRARIYGRCQKMWRNPMVSDLAEYADDVAGLGQAQEMAYQVRKALYMSARDLETTLLQSSAIEAQFDNGLVPNLTRSLGGWAKVGTHAVYPIPAAYTPLSGQSNNTATGSIAESDIEGVMAACASQAHGSLDMDLICGLSLKRAISGLSIHDAGTGPLRRLEIEKNVLQNTVDMIKTDAGVANMHLSFFVAGDTAYGAYQGYLVDFDMLELRYVRMPEVNKLPDQGGGPRASVSQIVGLVVRNPLTLGSFLATS